MLKTLLFLVGLTGGAGIVGTWLLSETGAETSPGGTIPEQIKDRTAIAKGRLDAAIVVGKERGADVENRKRHELDAFRRHPNRSGVSS